MADSKLTFREIKFRIEDELTHCDVRWESDDPSLCGYGARRTFPASVAVIDILPQIGVNCLTDKEWTVIRG